MLRILPLQAWFCSLSKQLVCSFKFLLLSMQCLLTPSLSCFFPHKRSLYLKNLAQNGPLSWYLRIFATPFILLRLGLGSLALPFTNRFSTVYTALINVGSFWGASKEQQLDGGEDAVNWASETMDLEWVYCQTCPALVKMQDIEDIWGYWNIQFGSVFWGKRSLKVWVGNFVFREQHRRYKRQIIEERPTLYQGFCSV